MRELKVIVQSRLAEHDPIKSLVVGKSADFKETEAVAVHPYRPFQFRDRARDSQVSLHVHYSDCLIGLNNAAAQLLLTLFRRHPVLLAF